MPGFKDYLRQQFPGIRITSGRRDPNSRLGRANPRSYHNQGMAWDTAPVEGMAFQQYVDRIGQDYDVLEARDEVNNPSKHATGPHWHVAVGGRKERPQVNNLASLMQGVYPMAQQEAQGAQPTSLADLIGQGALQPSFAPMTQENTPMPQMPKPKLFGEGGRGWQILGIIGDALQTAGGGQGTYMPYVAKQQELETEGRQRLAELLERQRQRQEDRDAALQGQMQLHDYRTQNPGPTNAQKEYEWARTQPGMENVSYQDWVANYYRPQFFEQGGQRYQVTPGGMPSGYDPNEWEVVQ